MKDLSIGIIGGGRIARILLGGWARAHQAPPRVVVTDIDGGPLARVQAEFPSVTASQDNHLAAVQDVVLFALHPPAFPTALAEIKGSLRQTAILVSLAPRWTMSRIACALGGFGRLARVIPNAPSIVNRGYNPLSFADGLPADERETVRSLFAPFGLCPEVAEESLEAYAIVAAMGPTYLWYQLYQLIELAEEFGLTPEAGMEAVTAMAEGAASTMAGAHLEPSEVMDLIPVKPLEQLEPTVTQAYGQALRALHAKLRG